MDTVKDEASGMNFPNVDDFEEIADNVKVLLIPSSVKAAVVSLFFLFFYFPTIPYCGVMNDQNMP